MFRFLTKIFIKDCDNVSDLHVREKYGRLSGIVGLVLNALLCASKIVVGTLTGAISVVSDGINNLSDGASSLITLIGFKLSAKNPTKNTRSDTEEWSILPGFSCRLSFFSLRSSF